MNPNKVIQLATKTGVLLLESGAETYRVEDTIVRLCQSFGMENANSFCTQTGLMVSAMYQDEGFSQVARIQKRETNLDRLCKLNEASRQAATWTMEEFEDRLQEISKEKAYDIKTNIVFGSLCTAGFTMMFRGNWLDILISFLLGGIVRYLVIKLEGKDVNAFFIMTASTFFITLTALLIASSFKMLDYNLVIAGTIMLLVPGLAMTNAIRDSIAGDLISGSILAIEAFLIALAIALGSGLGMSLWIFLGGVL